MDYYQVGPILKEFRTRHGISQEELCFGLCATSTLSRIENGRILPSRGLCEALFRRMGIQPPMEQLPMDKDEFRRYQLEMQIINEYVDGNYDFSHLLAAYSGLRKPDDIFNRQFHDFFRMMHQKYHNQVHPCFVHDHLVHTLRLTLKDFREGCNLTCRYLSSMELLILGGIAVNLHDLSRTAAAYRLMGFLKGYYETKIPDQQMKSRNYTAVLLHLSSWNLEEGLWREALELADGGIRFCMECSSLYLLPQLLFNKGICLAQLGEEESGRKHLHNAASLLDYMGRHEEAARLSEHAKTRLEQELPPDGSCHPPSGFVQLTEDELGEVGGGYTASLPLVRTSPLILSRKESQYIPIIF